MIRKVPLCMYQKRKVSILAHEIKGFHHVAERYTFKIVSLRSLTITLIPLKSIKRMGQ